MFCFDSYPMDKNSKSTKKEMPAQAKTKEEKSSKNLMQRLESFLTWLFFEAPESGTGTLIKIFKSSLRITIASTQKFIRDNAMVQASGISYSLAISLVPSIIVALLFMTRFIDISRYFMLAKEYVKSNGIPLDLEPYFELIQEFLNNAAAIGFIGFIITLFSATAVLRNLENALNYIWKVKHNRNFLQKVSGFIMVMIFGPVLLTVGISMGQSLVKKVAAPDLFRVSQESDNNVYALGDHATMLRLSEKDKWENIALKNSIDFQAQLDPIIFNADENFILPEKQQALYLSQIQSVTPISFQLTSFTDIEIMGNSHFIVTADGLLLFSFDNGKTWRLQKFVKEKLGKIDSVYFTRILMLDENNGIVIGKNGLVLQTDDKGISWQPTYIANVQENLNDILLEPNGNLIIVGDQGTFLISTDGGNTWENKKNIFADNNSEKLNFYSITSYKKFRWIAADNGMVLKSNTDENTWQRISTGLRLISFSGIHFRNEAQGTLIGDKGTIRYSEDGGITWKKYPGKIKSPVTSFLYQANKKRYIFVSDNYQIYFLKDTFKEKTVASLNSPFWRNFLSATGNLFLPFLVIWILFFLIYEMLPYTNVHFKAAAGGAVVTSFLYVFFINLFKVYISSFSTGTFAIYGTLAAIPLGLMLVYFSVLIILYGAEVSYHIQFPPNIKMVYTKRTESGKTSIWAGILVLKEIFSNYHFGKEPVKEEQLLPLCQYDKTLYEQILTKAQGAGYVQRAEGKIFPTKSPRLILLDDLFLLFDANDYRLPYNLKKDAAIKNMESIFKTVLDDRKEVFSNTTLEQILNKNIDGKKK